MAKPSVWPAWLTVSPTRSCSYRKIVRLAYCRCMHAWVALALQTLSDDSVTIFLTWIFTARRCAKRGICRRLVSVCLSVCLSVCVCVLCVCHTPVLYQNG